MSDRIEEARAMLASTEVNGVLLGYLPTVMRRADAYALAVLEELGFVHYSRQARALLTELPATTTEASMESPDSAH